VIKNAGGAERAAIEAFNRALYLEQSHYAALIHLALLHERRGEAATASNFRRRAERVEQKKAGK
jgi:chemotaxis protein methyltransferase WspC